MSEAKQTQETAERSEHPVQGDVIRDLEVFRDIIDRWRAGTPACKLCYGFNNNHLKMLDKWMSA